MPIIRNGLIPGVRLDSIGLTSAHSRPDPSKQACTKLITQQIARPVLLVELYEGATLRATRTLTPDPVTTTTALNLTSGEVASITDWTNLRVRLTASNMPGSIRVTDVYLEAPGPVPAAPAQTGNAAVATSTWVANNPAVTAAVTAGPSAAISTWVAVSPSVTVAGTAAAAVAISTWVTKAPTTTEGGISPSPAPAVSTWTARNPSTTMLVLLVELYEGATLRATRSVIPTSTVGTTALNLTSGEVASITNWTNLRVRLTATAPSGRIRVTDLYLEAPGASVGAARPAPAISTWVTNAPATAEGGVSATPAVAVSAWVTRDPSTIVPGSPQTGNAVVAISTWVVRDPSVTSGAGPQVGNATVAISTWVVRSPTVISPSTAIDPWFPGKGHEITWRRREEPKPKRKKHRHPLRVPKALRVTEVLEVLPPLQIPPFGEQLPPPGLAPFQPINPADVRPPLQPMEAEAPMAVAEPEERPAHWSEYAHLPYTAEDENEELQIILAAVLKR